MKVWITKYALSHGIREAEAEPSAYQSMVVVKTPGRIMEMFHGEGREWHRTKEAALARAEQMRQDKIASLEKQIARLRMKKFA